MGFHQIMTIYLKIPVNNEWKIANRQILPFLIHFNQHLAILYADFLFFKHQADNVCIASWVSRKCINSFINFASSKLSFVADIFSSLSETVNYHLDEKNLRQTFVASGNVNLWNEAKKKIVSKTRILDSIMKTLCIRTNNFRKSQINIYTK